MKAVTYGKFSLMNTTIFLNGLFIGMAMIAGNVLAMRLIRLANRQAYQRVVGVVMILISLWLMIEVK